MSRFFSRSLNGIQEYYLISLKPFSRNERKPFNANQNKVKSLAINIINTTERSPENIALLIDLCHSKPLWVVRVSRQFCYEPDYSNLCGSATIYYRRTRLKAPLWSQLAISQTLAVTFLSGLIFLLSTEISPMSECQPGRRWIKKAETPSFHRNLYTFRFATGDKQFEITTLEVTDGKVLVVTSRTESLRGRLRNISCVARVLIS